WRILSNVVLHSYWRFSHRAVCCAPIWIALRRMVESNDRTGVLDSGLSFCHAAEGQRQPCVRDVPRLGESFLVVPSVHRDDGCHRCALLPDRRAHFASVARRPAGDKRRTMRESIAAKGAHEKILTWAAIYGLFFGLMPPYVLTIVVVATW